MKKLIIAIAILLFCSNVYAETTFKLSVNKEDVLKINRIGYNILNANRIKEKMVFELVDKNYVNACTYYSTNLISVTDELLKIIEKEDELAAILAHEISHGVDYRQGILKGYFSFIATSLNSKKYEYKADKRAADYLVKAGYNPLALIVALNKIAPQLRFDSSLSHPLTSKRMAEIYEYIYVKYPQYLVQNEYKDNIYYQNFLITSKENRKKLENKIKSNSKKKVNYK
ncbi:MAG: hypothetical protein E7Z88_05660 [Cyanobacteria bacterium SIG27]|nr:hypothetical protein [Cyanobacteria bacterium SIG27]